MTRLTNRAMILHCITLLFLMSCKKDATPDIKARHGISNQSPGKFELAIDQVYSDRATISWQPPTDPDGDSLSYQLYLNDDLVQSNYRESRYTAKNLAPLTMYNVKVLALDPKGGKSSATAQFTTVRASQDSLLYHDGFEQGVNGWAIDGELNIGDGSSVISSEFAKTGAESLRMTSTHGLNTVGRSDNFRYRVFNRYNDVIVTMYLYFPQRIDLYKYPTAPNAFINLFQLKGASQDNSINDPLWVFGLGVIGGEGSGGANYLKMQYQGQQWPELGRNFTKFTPLVAEHPIPTNKWVKFKMRYYKHPTEGRIRVWQDDLLIYDESGLITDPSVGSPTATKLQFSINNYAESTIPAKYSIYLDDFSESLPATQDK